MTDMVVMCPNCTEKELSGYAQDYTDYYCSNGLEFRGCSHLSIVEKDVRVI